MPSNKYARRKFPDIDKALHLGATRLCEEYKKLALNEDNLNVKDLKALMSLSKTLISWRKEPVFQNLRILHETKVKDMRSPEEQLMDILGRDYVDEDDQEEEIDDSQSRF